jgi:hypothetical protein
MRYFSSICLFIGICFSGIVPADSGMAWLQNGDRMHAELNAYGPEGIELHSDLQDKPFQLLPGWLHQWRSASQHSTDFPENMDILTLTNGQAFYGNVTKIDREAFRFQTAWGAELQIPRNKISRFEPAFPVGDSLLKLEDWDMNFNNYANRYSVKNEWFATGGTFSHLSPSGHHISRRYDRDFSSFHVTYAFDFPKGFRQQTVYISSPMPGDPEKKRSIMLNFNGRSLMWRDSVSRQSRSISLPTDGDSPRVEREISMVYDLENQEVRLYHNRVLLVNQGIFVENPEQPTLSHPTLTLRLMDEKPATLKRLSLLPGVGTIIKESQPVSGSTVFLANGDQMDAELLSYDDGIFQMKLGELTLPLPAKRVAELKLHPLKPVPDQHLIRVTLQTPHPVLKVRDLWFDGENAMLDLPEQSEPLQVPRTQIAKLEWPEKLPTSGLTDLFRIAIAEHQQITGRIEALDEGSLRLRIPWITDSRSFALSGIREVLRVDPLEDKKPLPRVILSNGDVLRGSVSALSDDVLQLQDPSYGNNTVRLSEVRTILHPGEDGGTWILDPFQLQNNRLSRSQNDKQSKITAEGDVQFPKYILYRHKLPTQTPGYHLHVSMIDTETCSSNFRFDYAIKDRKRHGVFLSLSDTNLNISPRKKGEESFVLKSPAASKRSLDVFLDREKKRIRIRVDGEEVRDTTNSEYSFSQEDTGIVLQGFPKGVTFTDFQLTPWHGDTADETQGIGIWDGTAPRVSGKLVTLPPGGLGYQIKGQKELKAFSPERGYGLRFPLPETPSLADPTPKVALHLKDRTTLLRGTAIRISDERLIMQHPFFPQEFSVPVSEVQLIEWE